MLDKYPEIYVLRHGQTEWNLAQKIQGSLSSSLTEKGRNDATAQGQILLRENVVERELPIFSSPQMRVQDTADIAVGICGGTHTADQRLVEATQGEWEGLHIDEIAAGWPEIYENRSGDIRWFFENPTGETFASVHARSLSFLESLSGPTVIVTHGITSHILRGIWMGLDLKGSADLRGGQGWVHHLKDGTHTTLEL